MNKRFLTALLTGAFFLASTSMFVACKDYDDDIKNLQAQIDKAALQTDLQALKTSLESELSTLKASLATAQAELAQKANKADVDAALAKKADKEALEALAEKVVKLTERVATIETQISAINEALDKKADKTELAALEAALTGKLDNLEKVLTEKLDAEEAARKAEDIKLQAAIDAANANIELQKQALEAAKTALEAKDAELEALIGANAEAIEALKTKMAAAEAAIKKIQEETIPALEADIAANADDIATLKEQMQDAAEDIIELQEEVDVLNVLVTKQLTSLVLMPAFYWEGLEAIEVPYIKQTPLFAEFDNGGKGYTFNYKLAGEANGDKTVKVWVEKIMSIMKPDKSIFVKDTKTGIEGKDIWTAKEDGKASLTIEELDVYAGGADKYLKKNIAQGGVAKYHVNPATVDLSNTTIEFFTNFAEVYTRGDEATKPFAWAIKENAADNELKGGILTVPFKVDDAVLAATFANWAKADNQAAQAAWDEGDRASNGQKLPFIAAQLTDENDRVVTSDYAVVVPAEYKIIALADKAPEEALSRFTFLKAAAAAAHTIRQNHLYESVGYENCKDALPFDGPGMNEAKGLGAIPMPATHSVAYDSKIDLADFVETHYDYTTYAKYGKSTTDQVMDKATMEALGLSYNFTVINYTVGTNKTSESAHIQQDATSKSVFYPRSVDRNGNTIENATATREVIGREPLIRVDLVDADGDIIRYGYIKLRITDKEVQTNDISVEIALGEMWMDCGDSAKVTWSQMENQILRELNMTKQEFEAAYYLQVVGKENAAVTDMPTNENGSLYKKAAENGRFAVRYYKNADGKYVLAGPLGTASVGNFTHNDNLAEYSADDWKTVTVDNNWFGRVWYTPHDNSTTGHDWDENTNVLVWNFGNANDEGDDLDADNAAAQSNMKNNDVYQHMIKVVEASFENKGVNANAVSTVVRFINKNTGASVWVTLKFAPESIHFATAAINRRVLDHWYSMTEGYKDGVADTIEVYANVPTPAENSHQVALTTADFEKDLKEYWLDRKIVADLYNKDKFATHFYDAENDAFDGDITFQFRLPEEGVNADFSANENGEWTVKGISGIEYTLYLSASKKYIMVKKNEAAGMTHDQGLCYVTANGRIHFYGRVNPTNYLYSPGIDGDYEADPTDNTVNGPASDILNYIGMYDAQGKKQKDVYLTGQKDKTFTAFVEIKVSNDACYDPIIGHNYFNVRFLRPINVWPGNVEITDAPNATQWINIWKLLYIRDWRTYAVVMDGQIQKFADTNKEYEGKFVDGEKASVPYTFYGISNLYVKRNEIRSDAYLEPAQRTVLSDPTKIAALRNIDAIPALTNGNLRYLSIQALADYNTDAKKAEFAITAAKKGQNATKRYDDLLAYTNNGGVVKEFHIYVPIAVEYPWGALHGVLPEWTQTVWAVITVKPTTGNE